MLSWLLRQWRRLLKLASFPTSYTEELALPSLHEDIFFFDDRFYNSIFAQLTDTHELIFTTQRGQGCQENAPFCEQQRLNIPMSFSFVFSETKQNKTKKKTLKNKKLRARLPDKRILTMHSSSVWPWAISCPRELQHFPWKASPTHWEGLFVNWHHTPSMPRLWECPHKC